MKLLITLSLILVVSVNATITLPSAFSTDFKQTISNDSGKAIYYQGHLFFKDLLETIADDRGIEQSYTRSIFKWNYLSPSKKEVCSDGIQLVVVDHDLEQVSNYIVDESIDLKKILSLAKKITQNDYKATYKEVEYLISLNSEGHLVKIIYVDNLENSVKIEFTDMSYSEKLDNKLLECNAPKEYDVIKG